MSPGAEVRRSANSQVIPRSRTRRLKLRNWRVPLRLVALIVIPAVVAGLLAGLRVRDEVGDAAVFGRIERLATVSDRLNALVHELENERGATVLHLADPSRAGSTALREQRTATDKAAGGVRDVLGNEDGSYPVQVQAKLRDLRYRLATLNSLRELAAQSNASAASAQDIFSTLINGLLELGDLVAQGSPNAELAEGTRALAALGRAKDAASQERTLTSVVLGNGRFEATADRERLQAVRAQQDSQLAVFRATATLAQRQRFDDTVTGPQIGQIESLFQQLLILSDASPTLSVRPMAATEAELWASATATRLEQLRRVEKQIAGSVLLSSSTLRDDAQRNALVDAIGLLIGLVLALLATLIVARSLVRPLRRLRDGALEVAGTRLPGLVERLRDPQAAASGIEVDPIDIDSTDEIGQVARAFDEVHREAVRLAADEAVLRGNINAMFVNLSRRSQSLIERQLRLIDDLEQGEQDEERLASLFRLDHLATRMRRNCENLLVLGGQEQVRRWNQPVPLIDIVRASLSEVEQYERIGLRIQGEVAVVGPVVNDLVHLVAELVENATAFSPEHTKVTVSGHLLSGGGAMLQITDNGVGISPEDLESANWRLANPPVIDFSAARRMGLFVVGRLAVRHGIRVELRPALSGGITAFVLLPGALIARGDEPGGSVTPRRFDVAAEPPPVAAAWSPAPVKAGVAPAIGSGNSQGEPSAPLNRRDAFGTAPQPVVQDSGPMPIVGDQGPRPGGPPMPGQPGPRQTGPQPTAGQTGPQLRPDRSGGGPAVPPPRQNQSGPQPVIGQTGPQPVIGQTGPQPVVPMSRPMPPQAASLAGSLPGFPSSGEPGAPPWEPSAAALSSDYGDTWGAGEDNSRITPAGTPERSPIFDAMESEWFQRRSAGSGGRAPQPWESPGDAGWQAAEAVREPAASGVTSSGLPKRVPGRNRVPGAVAQPTTTTPQPGPPAPSQPADVVRNRFASLQRGVNRGRTESRTDNADENMPPRRAPGDTERGGARE